MVFSFVEDLKGKAKLAFNSEVGDGDDSEKQEQQPDRLEELSEYCPSLTWQQRLIGFAVSFSLGCKKAKNMDASSIEEVSSRVAVIVRLTHYMLLF